MTTDRLAALHDALNELTAGGCFHHNYATPVCERFADRLAAANVYVLTPEVLAEALFDAAWWREESMSSGELAAAILAALEAVA